MDWRALVEDLSHQLANLRGWQFFFKLSDFLRRKRKKFLRLLKKIQNLRFFLYLKKYRYLKEKNVFLFVYVFWTFREYFKFFLLLLRLLLKVTEVTTEHQK